MHCALPYNYWLSWPQEMSWPHTMLYVSKTTIESLKLSNFLSRLSTVYLFNGNVKRIKVGHEQDQFLAEMHLCFPSKYVLRTSIAMMKY